jgi:adenylate cyclase
LTHQYRSDRQAQGLAAWDIRIGIHSGPVIAGIVGRNKFAYDIWGDSVNLAARMESSAAVGTVNISRATYDLLQGEPACAERGTVEVKNRGAVEMFTVL